jgi:dynein heavy chain
VFVTPKSYLSFIQGYKETYIEKCADIARQQKNVETGLLKLKDAEVDVDKMKGVLEIQNVELAEAEKAANAMLVELEIGAKEANIAKEAAGVIEEKCAKTADLIAEETRLANIELEAAMPFVRAASAAAEKVTKPDIGIIQKLPKPPDLIKRIMDCVLILNLAKLDKITVTEIKVGKEMQPFIADSYDSYAKKFMGGSTFITDLMQFADQEKDLINDETIELLDPYLDCEDFNPDRAKAVSGAAEGLCMWVRAMHSYHHAALIVAPKLEQLKIKSQLFEAAQVKLNAAKQSSAAAQAQVDKLQATFQATMDEKSRLEKKAKETQDKMVAANNLINSLGGEKVRWSADASAFAEDKKKLVGDCALACAFVSYLGPFNQMYRKQLLEQTFYKDCVNSGIPVSKNMEVTKFLVDEATIAEWNSQTLPKDELSIQNGILVTKASRFPLLIDPQGQALQWLNKREAPFFPTFGTTSLSNPKLRDQLEFCMEEGKPLLVEGVVKELDPMFDPVLLKNVVSKGRSKFILLGDKAVTFDPGFRFYLLTKLGNPTFSPELSAKTTIIDFSVTQKGLEDQLLSRVIQFEQKSLEDQRQQLVEEVNMNTISLQALDKELLQRLSASSGNLLDDAALIGVLADTKTKAQEVKEKIEASIATEQVINKKREQYRPVATRGSVVYFVIVACSAINCMYQTSLAQFLGWFDQSMIDAEKANLVTKRVEILMDHLTFAIYIHINRGLFEKDKLIYKLMTCMKILVTETTNLTDQMVNLLLRGGAALQVDQQSPEPKWVPQDVWMNVCALSQSLDFFGDLKGSIEQNEVDWKKWYENETPEAMEIPKLEERLSNHPSGAFLRLLLLRSFRIDRFRLGAQEWIGQAMGTKYTDPVPARMEDVWGVSEVFNPVILMLTPGADPTSQLEELAKKKGVLIHAVSMGEGQEPFAQKAVDVSMDEGGWALLQNCHLGLGFMKSLDEFLQRARKEMTPHENFRLWITCEQHPEFPINLLQTSVKVTNEPPAGMKAGLFRSYTSTVDAERLARVETKEWRDLVFGMCFLHSVVQERRKFGPIGWCIPYEYNTSDLEASLQFLEKHSFSASGLNWETVQYMVCEIQYGGRITDDFDRCLFNTFGETWLQAGLMNETFTFYEGPHFKYSVPQSESLDTIRGYITQFPSHDSPEIFGLHGNADLTYGTAESGYMLNTINDTQPKETSAKAGAKTREEIVYEMCEDLLQRMPAGYKDDIVRDQVRKRSKAENEYVLGYKPEEKVDGLSIPLNVFLYQEITRLNFTINNVRKTLRGLQQAIDGEIIMTPQLVDALNAISDAKPPVHWYTDASGASIAWSLPSVALWFGSLLDREKQMTSWLTTTRPITYWLTGFFNQQGFLTAARQEVTRRHKAEKWALDDVMLKCDVTEHLDVKRIKNPPDEGVLIHGLFLEGCSWEKVGSSGRLKESSPKELFTPLPVLKVGAVTSEKFRKIYSVPGKYFYDCPCYAQPRRTDLNYIFVVKLESDVPPAHWVLRGVALLCTKD